MTATTSVTIRLGRDWCEAEGHKDYSPSPVEGVNINRGDSPLVTFVCWACLTEIKPTDWGSSRKRHVSD